MEYTITLMGQFIEEIGKIIDIMGTDNTNFRTQLFIKDSGKIICFMELDFSLIVMAKNGKDNLEMENLTVQSNNS